MPIHVFTHLVNHMCNYQEPLSGIFSPEEKNHYYWACIQHNSSTGEWISHGKVHAHSVYVWTSRLLDRKKQERRRKGNCRWEWRTLRVVIPRLSKDRCFLWILWGFYFLQHQVPLEFAGQRLSLEQHARSHWLWGMYVFPKHFILICQLIRNLLCSGSFSILCSFWHILLKKNSRHVHLKALAEFRSCHKIFQVFFQDIIYPNFRVYLFWESHKSQVHIASPEYLKPHI